MTHRLRQWVEEHLGMPQQGGTLLARLLTGRAHQRLHTHRTNHFTTRLPD
jgi:hypothetical protein